VVISRDLNNQTPVTLHFPATPTGTANLYTLTGDPRASNDAAMNIPIGTTTVSVTANYTFNMPPGSMYILQVPMTSAWSTSGIPLAPPPASLSANAGNKQVTLTWASSTGATSYNVLRGTVTGGPYTQIGTSTSVAYTDTAVTNGATYYYVVQSVNGGGASANSPEASATPNVENDPMTNTPPPLDGSNTGAWTSTPFIPLPHHFSPATGTSGSTDTAGYKTLWDSNYLYVLVSVQDNTPIPPNSSNIWTGDTVELYFSGTDTKSTTYGPTDFQYAFPYGFPDGGAVVTEADHGTHSLTGVLFGQQNIAGGYQMAMALPWTTLGTTPVLNQQYGFDVMIDDASVQGTRIGKLGWWATADSTWGNPSLMGPLVLTQAAIQSQTITFPAIATQAIGTPLTLTATATSGLPVSYASLTAAICTVDNTTSTATLIGYGTCRIQVTQAGNAGYTAAAPVSQSFFVQREAQTISFPAIATQAIGTPLTLTATATSGLPVSFISLTPAICTVNGTTATLTASGSCGIEATQTGDTTYGAAPVATRSFYVAAHK
jgi:hypothetical protein